MVRVTCDSDTFSLATASGTTRGTEGANPQLLPGGILRQVCVELPSSSAPIHVTVHLTHEGTTIELKSGWVRGPSDHGGAGALVWNGYQPIGHGPSLFVFARNDTGGTLVVTLHWNVERT